MKHYFIHRKGNDSEKLAKSQREQRKIIKHYHCQEECNEVTEIEQADEGVTEEDIRRCYAGDEAQHVVERKEENGYEPNPTDANQTTSTIYYRPLKQWIEVTPEQKPHEFLSAEQRDGSTLQAEEIYTETWEWLKKVGCAAKVSPQLLERYAMCSARWIQCEEMTNRMGFLSKHPTTQKPIPSPFINIGINYMNQAVRLWNEIFQIVKENCSTDYGEVSPQDDLMERLLRARKG